MDARALLRSQFAQSFDILDQTVGDCSQAALDKTLPGATVASIGAIYAHLIQGQDNILAGARGRPTVHESGGWGAKTGVPMANWTPDLKLNLANFSPYAKAVREATDQWLAGASDAELDREVDSGFAGKMPAIAFLSFGLFHTSNHAGEIAALKGAQGLKGLPF